MNGTLALWYEPCSQSSGGPERDDTTGRAPFPPQVSLHVNLWRDIDRLVNFLDVGFLLTNVSCTGRLYLFLPAPIPRSSIRDLGDALRDADTLNAVFNEVAEVVREEDQRGRRGGP